MVGFTMGIGLKIEEKDPECSRTAKVESMKGSGPMIRNVAMGSSTFQMVLFKKVIGRMIFS
jgi:hypothetical protein